jgi:hypothetical protein
MIIRAQDGVTNNIMINFKSLCSTSTSYQHGEGKYLGGVEEYDRSRSGEASEQLFNTST